MPSSFTTLKSLEKQATGENENTWGDNLNDVLDMIDTALGGRLSLSVAGSSNVTLTAAQALNPIQEYTGTLTGSIAVIVPTASGWYLVRNATAGSYTLTVRTSGGTGPVIPQGYRALVYCDGTNVVQVAGAGMGAIPYRAITSGDTIVAADRGVLIDATSGTFSLAVTAVATLGAGFFCWVRNSGSGVVTIDPDGTEQIDGAASKALAQGQSCLVVCNGSLLRTIGLPPAATESVAGIVELATQAEISTGTDTERAPTAATIAGRSPGAVTIDMAADSFFIRDATDSKEKLAAPIIPKVGSFTRDLSAATGSASVTGVGFKPRAIIILSNIAGNATTSIGVGATGIGQAVVANFHNIAADQWTNAGSNIAYGIISSGNFQSAALASLDADGFTLSWTKTGSPTGTLQLYYLAIP